VSQRRELLVALLAVLIGWIVLMSLVSRWQRSRAGQRVTIETPLVHYPGTESVEEQTEPNMEFRRYWFHLNEDYPSLSVFHFYRQKLEPDGWRMPGNNPPNWVRQQDKDTVRNVFHATWVNRTELFQLDLEMMSTAKVVKHEGGTQSEQRQPGLDVFVTQRRVLMPGLTYPPPESAPESKKGPAGPQIEVK